MAIVLAVLAIFILTSGCGQRPAPVKPEPPATGGLDSEGLIVVALSDGGAYANDAAGGVWYVRGHTGTPVRGLPDRLDVLDIAPTVDGGAYVASGNGLWYLREDTAVKVKEGPPEPRPGTALSTKEKWLWAALQVERQARRRAQAEPRTDK